MNVGIVGIGFMGMIHYLSYQKVRGAKVTAIATRDRKKLAGDWRGIQGNFGPPGEQMDLAGIRPYERWQDLLSDPKVDLVDICLPQPLHAEVAIAALKAGKHVLVEKPITVSLADGQRMVRAAQQAKRLLLVAHALPFFPEYAWALKAVESGKYGKLLGGTFKRVIADPLWMKDFYDPQLSGGPVIDLSIHDVHFIRLLCGMPKSVFTTGRLQGKVMKFFTTQMQFADPRVGVTVIGGALDQQGRSFCHGFEIYLERATLSYEFAVLGGEPKTYLPLTLMNSAGKVVMPDVGGGDAFIGELNAVVKSVRDGKEVPALSGALALDALRLCHKQTESMQRGKLLKV